MTKPRPFGHYFILEKIAQGGMAEIFKGLTYDFSGLKKFIVIKRILPHIAVNKDFIRMLIDEAKIAVRLSHGNIAQTYDLGKVADDYFIVMEYVEGKTLSQIFKKAAELKEHIPIPMAAYFISELCSGLDYIHRRVDESGKSLEIVHRDISPQNVIVSYSGNVKIVDFGVAKAAWKLSELESGVLKGKFAYMSPEQTEGKAIDHRSDLFATGVVLWEILTGRRLFKKKSNAETIEAVQKQAIYPPSSYRNEIPSDLDQIVMKSLDRKSEKRYPNADDLGLALTKFNLKHYPEFKPTQINEFLNRIFEDEDLTGDLYQEKTTREELTVKESRSQALDFEEPVTTVEDTMIVDPQELDFHSIFEEIDVEEESDITRSVALTEGGSVIEEIPKVLQEEESTGDFAPDFLEEPLPPAAESRRGDNSPQRRIWVAASVLALILALWIVYRFGVSDEPAQLKVTFDPPDARLELDGKPNSGSSPVLIPGLKPRRSYQVALFRDGYEPLQSEVSLWPGFTKDLGLKMKKLSSGVLQVTSNPPGAAIYVDGQTTGKITPDFLTVAELKFPLVIGLSKGGPPSWQQRLDRPPSQGQIVHGDLTIQYGQLEVETSPSGAQIKLDGKTIGKTPLRGFSLPALKESELEIILQGFDTYRTKLQVHPGEKEKIYHALRKQPSR